MPDVCLVHQDLAFAWPPRCLATCFDAMTRPLDFFNRESLAQPLTLQVEAIFQNYLYQGNSRRMTTYNTYPPLAIVFDNASEIHPCVRILGTSSSAQALASLILIFQTYRPASKVEPARHSPGGIETGHRGLPRTASTTPARSEAFLDCTATQLRRGRMLERHDARARCFKEARRG